MESLNMTVLPKTMALCMVGLLFSIAVAAESDTQLQRSVSLVRVGWEHVLFPGLALDTRHVSIDEPLRHAVKTTFGVEAVEPIVVYFAKDGTGKLRGGLLQSRISYLDGKLTLAVGLNEESRIIKVMIPESDSAIYLDVHDLAPQGIVTRYTMTSLPQVRQIAKSLQDSEGLGAVVAREVLRAGGTLRVLMDRLP